MKKLVLFGLALLLLGCVPALYAQTVSGNIAVTIQDRSGAAVPKASVTAVNTATGFTKSGTANDAGELLFSDLPLGQYNITVTAAGFAKNEKTNFPVQLNRTNSATFVLDVQTQTVTVEVTGAPPPINTTTSQIEGTFEARETADLPTAGLNSGSGVINLALLEPGVATQGGVGYGTGPSVGGQRPTNNSYTVEGVDNNALSVTGPVAFVPNDAVAEFSTLQNNYSPEFGHSNGGNFNTTIKSGTNAFHGAAYEYLLNRYLNATDQAAIVSGLTTQRPRYDNNRFGGDFGGPIIKDKLFFYALGEYNPVGQAAFVSGGICSPTAAGYTALAALPAGPNPNTAAGAPATVSLNTTNLGQLSTYLAPSPAGGTCAGLSKYPSFPLGAGPYTLTHPDYVCTGGAIPTITKISAASPTGNATCPSGTLVPIDTGVLSVVGPNYDNFTNLVFSGDYNMSSKDQFRMRYIYNKANTINAVAALPVFYSIVPARDHLVALNEYHTFRPDLTNEFRLGFNRFATVDPVGPQIFPGLGVFPNLQFSDLNLQLGPNPNFPQSAIQNVYQASENLNWSHKNHNVRVGVEVARYISPSSFTQRARGDYDYSSISTYLYDLNPDQLAERSTGSHIYYQDQVVSGVYFNDTWRIKPSLSFSYGMRYEYGTIPFGERAQALNAAAGVPGLISFGEPSAPKNQFMPRVGFAWSPDKNRTWSIRGGIFMGYDVSYDNLGTLSFPPQFSSTHDKPQSAGLINNFLANGAIPAGTGGLAVFPACFGLPQCGIFLGANNTAIAGQQAATAAEIPNNFNNPVAVSYSLGVQHVFGKNYTLEVRYLGTHGYHLPTQVQLNKQTAISPTSFIPTFLTTPTAAQLGTLTNTTKTLNPVLGGVFPINEYVPAFVSGCVGSPTASLVTDGLLADNLTPAPCFASNVTSFQFQGNSVYHGASAQLTRRFEHGLQLNASYTFSHAIDDSTAAVFSTVITPRRPQDFQNLQNDRSNSALDHRHRFTLEAYYDLPYFKSGNWFKKNVLGNWFFTPVYTFQAGGWGDPQAGADVNLNGDSAGDRVLLNPAGIGQTGTGVNPACLIGGVATVGAGCTSSNTVAYVAQSSTARYINTGAGGLEPNNGLLVNGRNTLQLRPIDSIDITIGKKFSITERVNLQFQAQFFNFLNHPQYIPGSLDDVVPIAYTGGNFKTYLEPNSSTFNRPDLTFSSNPRVIQLAAKLVF